VVLRQSHLQTSVLVNTAWYSTGTVFTLLTVLLSSVIVARYLGPGALGLLGLAQSIRLTVMMGIDFGLPSAVIKFVAELRGAGKEPEAETVARALTRIQASLAVLAGVLLAATSDLLAELLGQPAIAPLLHIVALSLTLTLLNAILAGRLLGLQQFRLKITLDAASAVLGLMCIALVIISGSGIREVLWVDVGIAAGQAIVLFTRTVLWRAGSSAVISRELKLSLVRYCLGVFLMTSVEAVIWQRSEVFLLGRFGVTTDIAFYTVSFTLATVPITLIPFSLAAALLPVLSERFGAQGRTSFIPIYAAATKYNSIVALPICAIVMGLAGPIVRVIYGDAYDSSANIVRILLVGAGLGALFAPGSHVFLALGQPATRAIWGIPIAAFNVVLAFVLVVAFGVVGAAIAKSTSETLHVFADALYLRRARNATLPLGQIARAALAALPLGIVGYVLSLRLEALPSVLVTCVVSISYVPLLLSLRVVDATDFELLHDLTDVSPRPVRLLLGPAIQYGRRMAGLAPGQSRSPE